MLLLFSPAHAQISRGTTAHFNNWTLAFGTDVNCDVEIFHDNVFECSNSSGYALNSQIEVKSDNLINVSLVNIFNAEWLNFSAVNTSANTEANITIGVFQTTDKIRVYHYDIENITLGPLIPNSTGYINFTWTFAGEKNFELRVPPYQLDLNSPITDYNSSSTNITFNWTGYDSSTNLTTNLTIDGVVNVSGINTNNATSTPKNISGLAEGVHNWSVTIIDAGGNTNSSPAYNFTIDISPPNSFSLGTASPGVVNKRENVAINITVTDVLLEIDTAIMEVTNPQSVKKNYTMTKGTGNEFTRSISGDDTDVLGTYYVDFYANDTVGNMNFSDFNLSFSITKKSSPSPGGGGGGSPRKISAFSKRMSVINSSIMAGVIKELKLGAKRFYRMQREMAPVFAATSGRTGDYPAPKTDISAVLTNPIEEVIGDIYEISAIEVLKAWKSSGTVVIARGDLEVDSMAAIAYAKTKNVPILLTKPNELPSFTLDAVKKLNARNFVIVGGDVAVNGEVVDELERLGTVTRIAGKDRYETSVEVAKSLGDVDTIVIADGERPSLDAVIIASGYNAPVLYVTGTVVPKSTQDFVKAHRLTKRGKEVKLVLVDVSDYIINYRFDKDF